MCLWFQNKPIITLAVRHIQPNLNKFKRIDSGFSVCLSIQWLFINPDSEILRFLVPDRKLLTIIASNISIRPPQNAPNFKLCKELLFLSLELVTFQRFLDSFWIK